MNQVIFTHPRSGSTAYSNQIANEGTNILNLKEFLNPYCPNTFGGIQNFFIKNQFNRSISVPILKRSRCNSPNTDLTAGMYLYKSVDVYFDNVFMHFKSVNDIVKFLEIEQLLRINFLSSIKHINWAVKQFITDKSNYNNLLLSLPDTTNIFYYRKDIVGSILSSLIKTYYFDMNPGGPIDAHNYADRQITNIEFQPNLNLELDSINKEIKFIINLLELYKQYKTKFHKIVCYEDEILTQNSHVIGNMLPMPYATDKQDYFTNSKLVNECIETQIKQHNLQDVVEELGMII